MSFEEFKKLNKITMNRIFTFFILSLLFTSCSDNDNTGMENQFPVIENISVQTANVGDAISINGTGFHSNENYIVRFNGTEGLILEINSNYLKVEVPQGATSGDITLSVNGQTKTIGTININSSSNFALYAFKSDDEINSTVVPSIVKIDPSNGNETTITTLTENIDDLAFNNETNQIYGVGEENALFKIDVTNGTTSSVNLDNSSFMIYELITDNENNLYAFKGEDEINSTVVPSIVKIDLSNGNETKIATLTEYITDLAFNDETNQIYGVGEENALFKIDVTNGTTSSVNLDNSSHIFYELVTDNHNNLYAFKGDDEINSTVVPSIVKIDPTNGNETTIATLTEYVSELVFNDETNQIYGVGWEDNKLFKIDVRNGTTSSVNLDNSSYIFYELVAN